MIWLATVVGVTANLAAQTAIILAVILALELIWPKGRIPWMARLRGASFAALNTVVAAIVLATSAMGLPALGLKPLWSLVPPADAAPWVVWVYSLLKALIVAALSDFLYYWFHRAQHRWFWRFHSIHHSIRDMSVLSAYQHWTEELFRLPFIAVPLFLIAPDGPTLYIVGTIFILQSYYLHAASWLHFGPLGRVISDNRFHRIHHSMEERHFDKNFGVFSPLWDVLFGTAYFPAKDEWPATGVADSPEIDGIGDFIVRPFRSYSSSGLTNHKSLV